MIRINAADQPAARGAGTRRGLVGQVERQFRRLSARRRGRHVLRPGSPEVVPAEIGGGERAGNVVEQGRRVRDRRIALDRPGRAEPAHDECLDKFLQRHAMLEPEADRMREPIHQAARDGAVLGQGDGDLAQAAVRVFARSQEQLVAADRRSLRVAGVPRRKGAPFRARRRHRLQRDGPWRERVNIGRDGLMHRGMRGAARQRQRRVSGEHGGQGRLGRQSARGEQGAGGAGQASRAETGANAGAMPPVSAPSSASTGPGRPMPVVARWRGRAPLAATPGRGDRPASQAGNPAGTAGSSAGSTRRRAGPRRRPTRHRRAHAAARQCPPRPRGPRRCRNRARDARAIRRDRPCPRRCAVRPARRG